ncbi:MAG: winged helix-turn-helix domain-containing protein [Pyrinomonadaceae bacterium]
MNRPVRHYYEFGRFRIDETERGLFRDEQRVPLAPKAFDTLLALVSSQGHLLSRRELMDIVWADSFVEGNNLTQCVSALRKVLGDPEGRIIETIPRRGYRFTQKAREVFQEDSDVTIERTSRNSLSIEQETETTFSLNRKWLPALGFAFAIVLVGGLAWNLVPQDRGLPTPFQNAAASSHPAIAYELYEKGRALWQTRNAEDLHEATLLLERSVEHNPDFALGHSALADAYAFDFRNWRKAETAAREALRIDPTLGEAHATIGFVRMFWEWRFQDAEAEFKQALKLSPDYATAHQWYAINLFATGTAGHAGYVEMNKALELEPHSPSINADMCQALYFLRRYDEAIDQCTRALGLNERPHNEYVYLYEIYSAKEMFNEAVESFFKIEENSLEWSRPGAYQTLREAYDTGGIRSFWRARIDSMSGSGHVNYRIARYYARLGETENALLHVEKAYQLRDVEFLCFLSDPVFDILRAHPRYRAIQKRLLSLSP